MTVPARKLPALEPDTAFFWTSGADGQLRVLHCPDCGQYQHPPLPRCRHCHSEGVSPQVVSGRGRVTSYTINYEPWLPELEVPFVFAVVELAEQPHLLLSANILEADAADLRLGMPLEVVFETVTEECALPQFRPVGG